MSRYFGTDGIRGKANIGLSAETAFKVGRYLGYYYSQDGRKTNARTRKGPRRTVANKKK